jgi:hypothetical protein
MARVLFQPDNFNMVGNTYRLLSRIEDKKKAQAALPAEMMWFVVRLRETFGRTTSDTIAVLLMVAKNHLEKLNAEKRGVAIDRMVQLKKQSLESWKIQSVIPESVYKYINDLSRKLDLKISPAIAIVAMIGADLLAQMAHDETFWLDFLRDIKLDPWYTEEEILELKREELLREKEIYRSKPKKKK